MRAPACFHPGSDPGVFTYKLAYELGVNDDFMQQRTPLVGFATPEAAPSDDFTQVFRGGFSFFPQKTCSKTTRFPSIFVRALKLAPSRVGGMVLSR
jgi:hypothetical protein